MKKSTGLYFFLSLLFVFVSCTERRQVRLLHEADSKLSQGDYTTGEELLRKVIAQAPESKTSIKALYKLGFALESSSRDFDGALFNYSEFIRLSKDPVSNYEVQKRIANLYYENFQDSKKAITAYRKLISLNPDSLEMDFFQFRIAESYFRLNNFDQARQEYRLLLDKFPKSQFAARTRFEIGNAYYMEGRYDVAIEALKQVERYHPTSEYAVEAEFLTAECYDHEDKLQSALQEYNELQGRYPVPAVLAAQIEGVKKRMSKMSKLKQ